MNKINNSSVYKIKLIIIPILIIIYKIKTIYILPTNNMKTCLIEHHKSNHLLMMCIDKNCT